MARVLLYDGECGFCTRSARRVRQLGCEVETVPWQSWTPLTSHGITAQAAAVKIHLVDGNRIRIGHEAIAGTLLRSRYAVVRLAGRVIGSRPLRPLARRVYAAVSANRQRLPGDLPTLQRARPSATDERHPR